MNYPKICRRFFLALAFLAVSAWTSPLEAQTTTNYTGHIGEVPVNVTIVWANYHGLGRVWGTINYAGRRISFSGQNYQSGRLRFVDSDGDHYELRKQNTRSTIGWKGTGAGMTVTISRRR